MLFFNPFSKKITNQLKCLSYLKSKFQVLLELSGKFSGLQKLSIDFQRASSDLFGLGLTFKNFSAVSRDGHQTCSIPPPDLSDGPDKFGQDWLP
jgi:hypothetical protein